MKDGNQVGGEQVLLQIRMGREDVEADGKFLVGRVKYHDIRDAMLWNRAANPVNQVPVRVKHGKSFAVLNILADQIKEKGGLACPGCADHIGMADAQFGSEADVADLAGVMVFTQQKPGGIERDLRRGFASRRVAPQLRDADG